MNNHIANMGAIDGVQGEYVIGKYIAGAFAGTRPDFTNFTFNAGLPQFGAYLVRTDKTTKGMAQTTIAVAEQMNQSNTDRRFIYFQHNNSLVKNLNLCFSSEMDLYKKVNEETSNQPQLTSIYASLRYRIRSETFHFQELMTTRRNIIYYESYQTFIEQLLAQETRQGFRVQANYSPFKKISVNASAFFRYQGDNPTPTKNYVANMNINSILHKSTNTSFSLNLLESYYFKGTIAGGRISDNFIKGKLNVELNYRNINYTFYNSESNLRQHIGGISFSFNLMKKTALMCSYEGTFEPSKAWHRYFVTIRLDPIGRRDVIDILSEYHRQGGTIFLTSHVLHDVERLADRFGLIHKGELRAVRAPAELVGGEEKVLVRSQGEVAIAGMIAESGGRWVVEVTPRICGRRCARWIRQAMC